MCVFADGERFPMIVDVASGTPIFGPVIYCLSMIRARNRATNTIDQALRSLLVLFEFCRHNGIRLDERLRSRVVLALGDHGVD